MNHPSQTATMSHPADNNPHCPACGELRALHLIKTTGGGRGVRQWINPACPACGLAMDPDGKWTCYAGQTVNP